MMSSFHEDSGFTPVENLDPRNFHHIMSPVTLLSKSDFGSPKTLLEINSGTPALQDEIIKSQSDIPAIVDTNSSTNAATLTQEFEYAESALMSSAVNNDFSISPMAGASTSIGGTSSDDNDNEDASLRFALQLQYQEEEELIQIQLANLRAVVVAGGLSGDDISTMQMMMSDLQQQLQIVHASAAALNPRQENSAQENNTQEVDRSFVDSQNGDEGENDQDEEEEEEEEEGEERWDYEQLLQLGQRLGDVKTERWRMRAQAIINTLPTMSYKEACKPHSAPSSTEEVDLVEDADILTLLNDSAEWTATKVNEGGQFVKKAKLSHDDIPSTATENNTPAVHLTNEKKPSQESEREEYCIVCMEPYISEDMVTKLPCKHYFHCHCAQGWLVDHNSCPYCKTKVTATP